MSLIDRLLGRSKDDTTGREDSTWESSDAHAFDRVQEGEKLLKAGSTERAEEALRQAVDMYRRQADADGVAFALGRLGNFYHKVERAEDAVSAYQEAISLGTDIPAIYADLMHILASQGDGVEFFRAAEEYYRRSPAGQSQVLDLVIHLTVNQVTDVSVAEGWLVRAQQWAKEVGQTAIQFTAWGQLGRLYEKAGQVDKAVRCFEEAVAAGSAHRMTFTRLLIAYEKAKRWDDVLQLAERGLAVQHDAAWEAELRKRIERVRRRSGTARDTEPRTIPVFSVRQGAANVQLVAQINFSPPISKLALSPDGARAFLSASSKRDGNLVLYDLDSQAEVWRSTAKKTSAGVLASVDRYFAITEEGRIGEGSADVVVFGSAGHAQASITLPDKLTDVRLAGELIIVGCRDGSLNCFDYDGNKRWTYHVRQRPDLDPDSPYQRPCPYFVSVSPDGSRIMFSSWDEVFMLDDAGRLLWKWKTETRDHKLRYTVPLDAATPSSEYFRTLGLPSSADSDEIRKAFRRRAFETHPDHHPTDPMATDRFKAVVRAYEALSTGAASGDNASELTIEISMMSGLNTIYGLAVGPNGDLCAVTSSDGYLTFLNGKGVLLHSLVAGEGMGTVAASSDLSVLVYANWNGLNFYGPDGFKNVYPTEKLLKVAVRDDGGRTAAWHGRELFVFDEGGRLLAELEFVKNIGAIAFRGGEELLVAAGKLVRLRI